MTKISVSFLVFLLLLFVLVVPEIEAEDGPKLCEKPGRTIWFGKCEDKSCDGRCKFWERAIRGACLVRDGKPGACFCYYECSKSPPPPPADGGSPPPPAEGGSPPPPAEGGSPPPPSEGGSPPPPADGGSQPHPAMRRKSKTKVIA